MNWIVDRQTTIYSRVKAILTSKLKKKYDSFLITEDNATPTKAVFPTVYITFVGLNEMGQTLDGMTINAINITAEVHVKTSKAQGMMDNREIAWDVVEAFKSIGFTATMPNIPTSNLDGVYESVSRFSRVIGQGDVI